jgi:glycogen debranching enzyme
MEGVKKEVLGPLKLWQYYVVDVAGETSALAGAWDQASSSRQVHSLGDDSLSGKTLADALPLLQRHALRNRMSLGERFTTHLDGATTLAILRTLAQNEGKGKDDAVAALKAALDEINAPLYALYDEDTKAIIENLGGRLTYMRVEAGGPKMGPITKE